MSLLDICKELEAQGAMIKAVGKARADAFDHGRMDEWGWLRKAHERLLSSWPHAKFTTEFIKNEKAVQA